MRAATVDAFMADVARDEALLKDIPGFTKRLRFPYRKEGARRPCATGYASG